MDVAGERLDVGLGRLADALGEGRDLAGGLFVEREDGRHGHAPMRPWEMRSSISAPRRAAMILVVDSCIVSPYAEVIRTLLSQIFPVGDIVYPRILAEISEASETVASDGSFM